VAATPVQRPYQMRRAIMAFIDGSLGAFLTLLLSDQADVTLESGRFPDDPVFVRILLSVVIGGMISFITYTRTWLSMQQYGNGNGHSKEHE
jgi:uncharacterized integral membrane protein